MKLLVAVKAPLGSTVRFPSANGVDLFATQVIGSESSDRQAVFVAVVNVEAAFEISDEGAR